MAITRFSYQLFILASPDRIWQALTDPEVTRRYWYGALNRSEWQPGSRWVSAPAEGSAYLDGEVLEVEAPRRMVHTFHVLNEPQAAAEAPSKVTIEIEPLGAMSRLQLEHEDLSKVTASYVSGGWEYILSSLKTLLETGDALPSDPSG